MKSAPKKEETPIKGTIKRDSKLPLIKGLSDYAKVDNVKSYISGELEIYEVYGAMPNIRTGRVKKLFSAHRCFYITKVVISNFTKDEMILYCKHTDKNKFDQYFIPNDEEMMFSENYEQYSFLSNRSGNVNFMVIGVRKIK